MAFICPCSAARRHHFTASSKSISTPSPFPYIAAMWYCALLFPVFATIRIASMATAFSSSVSALLNSSTADKNCSWLLSPATIFSCLLELFSCIIALYIYVIEQIYKMGDCYPGYCSRHIIIEHCRLQLHLIIPRTHQ